MDSQTCAKCGVQNPEHVLRFVKVNVNSTSSTSYSGRKQITTTTTTEQLVGVDRTCFCENCIKSKRLTMALGELGAGIGVGFLGAFFLMLFFSGKDFFNSHAGTIALGSVGVGIVLGAIMFLIGIRKPTQMVAAEILQKKEKGVKYIPIDRSLYVKSGAQAPDLETFKSKSGLRTNVAMTVFMQFIASGLGEAMVDAMLANNGQPVAEAEPSVPAAEAPSQNTPPQSPEE